MNPLIHDLLEKLLNPDEKIAENVRHQLHVMMCLAGGFDSYGEQEKRWLPPELQTITLDIEEQRAIVAAYTDLIKSGYQFGGSLVHQMSRLQPLVYMDYLLDIILHHMDKLSGQHDTLQAIIALQDCLIFSSEDNQGEIDRLLKENDPIPAIEALLERSDFDENDKPNLEHLLIDLRWHNHPFLQPDKVKEAIQSGKNMQYAPLHDIDLQGTDLRQANVRGATFSGSNLNDTNLEGVNLHGSRFLTLERANLRNANLTGTDLASADVNNADLTGTNLHNADLQGANLTGCNFTDTDLTGANLAQANLQGALLTNTTFDETTRLPNADFWTPDADLTIFTDPAHPNFWQGYVPDRDDDEDDDFSDADFSGGNLQAASLSHAILHRTNFSKANLRYVEFSRADCEGASFRNADLQHASLVYANFSHTDLRGTNLKDSLLWNSTFDGAQFDEMTILPDGTNWSAKTYLERFTNPHHPEFDKKYYPILGIGSPWERDKYPELLYYGE